MLQCVRGTRGVGCGLLAFLAILVAGSPASANVYHYCYTSASPNMAGHGSCEVTTKYQVSYNQVDADADAVCESLSDYVPAPDPTTGLFAAPENCISTGATSAAAYYNGAWHYPWIGNRHSYWVTILSGTHFDDFI